MPLREYPQIPLYIVEDHNEVLQFILKGIGSKHLSFNGNLLIHFDSHPDLLLSEDLKPDDVFSKEDLVNKVSIETWILPLVFAEHVSTVAWIKPLWSNQIDDGIYTLYIGGTKESEIKIYAPLLYFISALNYAPYEKLINPRKLILHVMSLTSCKETIENCSRQLKTIAKEHGSNILLDIDLDFFSTMNPFIEMYGEAKMYERLRLLYNFEDEELKNSSPEAAELKRKSQIESLKGVFKVLEENGDTEDIVQNVEQITSTIKEKNIRSALKELILDLCKIYKENIDWEMVHNAGTTIDDPQRVLPHHMTSKDDIITDMKHFKAVMKSVPRPKIITMARSSFDDYCPPGMVNFIQDKTCAILSSIFNPSIEKHYEEA